MTLSIRPATLRDVERLTVLVGQLGYPSTTADVARRLARLLRTVPDEPAPDGEVLVAELAREGTTTVIGCVEVALVRCLTSEAFGEIRGLVVEEGNRSAGVGAALVAAAEDWIRSQGVATVRVRSNILRERTHRFYERLGYDSPKSQKMFTRRLSS